MRSGELPVEAGLAYAGLADDGDDLAVPGAGALESLPQLLHFAVAPDEAREATRSGGLQPRAHRARPDDLEDLEWDHKPFDLHWAKRLHLNIALGQRQSVDGD